MQTNTAQQIELEKLSSVPASASGFRATQLNEDALAALDEAAKGPSFNIELLQTTPVRDISRQIKATVAMLEALDHRGMMRKQGVLSRLTGADVEARLQFELASQGVLAQVRQLRQAALNGKRIRSLLKASRQELIAEQDRLEQVIAAAKRLLTEDPGVEEFVVSRFERRLSNIMAIHASNILTIEQISLSERLLASLLDRFTDVDTLLLPLWQRNVIAVAHASGWREQRAASSEFDASNKQLIGYLKQETVV